MRISATLLLLVVALTAIGCGDSHNVTVRNECQQKVNVQFECKDGTTLELNGIAPGQEDSGTISLGPTDVKAVFPEGGVPAPVPTGLKALDGESYKLTIRGNPPGIFVEVE